MLLELSALVAGLLLTIWSADRFVDGAAASAGHLGIGTLTIGLTVVALGTSAPEILTAALAAFSGHPDIGIGNAIGSNIANIGLVLGATALVAPMAIRSVTLRRELPLLVLVTLFTVLLMVDGRLSEIEALGLLLLLAGSLVWIHYIGRNPRPEDPLVAGFADQIPRAMGPVASGIWLAVGLLVLLAAAHLLVWGAAGLAVRLGISDLVIGLTIIAVGTSLPELATSIAAVLKRQSDIAVGNILGSNLFNLVAVLPLPALIAPGALPEGLLTRDLPVMLGLTLLVVVIARGFGGPGQINRWQGGLLLTCFVIYHAVIATGAYGPS